MKMKATLKIIALIPLFLSLIIILAVFWSKREIRLSREIDKTANKMVENAFRLNLKVDEYLLNPSERPKIQFRSIHGSQKRLLETIHAKTDEGREIIKRIRQNHESMGPLFDLLVTVHEATVAEKNAPSAELREMAIGQILALSREIVSDSFQLSRISQDRMDSVQGWSITFLLFSVLISGTGLAIFSYLLGRKIERGNEELKREITERKRAEEALKQQTLELQRLTEKLEERVKERTAELASLSSQLVSAQENERRRVSYDLHDNVWQTLVAIRFGIERLFSRQDKADWAALHKKSGEVMTGILGAVGKIRSMQGDLWPYVLDDIGILATIDWYCREFGKTHSGLTIESHIDVGEGEVPSSAKIVIYRVMQEAMSNVVKHSRASHVTLSLINGDHRVEFTVVDSGIGFDPQEMLIKRSPWGGLGLLSIKARTELSGGSFGIESVRGKGTTVRASWLI